MPVRMSLLKRDRVDDAPKATSDFTIPAAEAFTFRLLEGHDRDSLLTEMDAGGTPFSGEFFHQHFGEHETISGFLGLRVDVWISLRTFHVWIDARWRKRRPGADKLVDILSQHFPHASPSRDAFLEAVAENLQHAPDLLEAGQRMGQLHGTPRADVTFVKYKFTAQDAASKYVKALHERMEPLLLFLVDGASLIDNEDPQWELLLAVRKPKDGTPGQLVLGMQTVYNFWAWTERSSGSVGAPATRASLPLPLPARFVEERSAAAAAAAAAATATATAQGAEERTGAEAGSEKGAGAEAEAEAGRELMAEAVPMETDGQVQQGAAAHAQADAVQPEQPQQPQEQQQHASDPGFQRLRLSQVVILPPFQGLGIGKQLLSIAYDMALTRACHDLTLEDPSPNMNRMREKLELERMLATPWLMEGLRAVVAAHTSSSTPSHTSAAGASDSGSRSGSGAALAPPPALLSRITSELKIHRRQARQVWEALLFLEPSIGGQAASNASNSPSNTMGTGATPAASASSTSSYGPWFKALEDLIRRRLTAQQFGHVGKDAELKQVIDTEKGGFIMMRTKKHDVPSAGPSSSLEAPTGSAGPAGGDPGQAQSVGGRLSVVMVSKEEKEREVTHLLQERLEELVTLARLLKGGGKRDQAQGGAAGTAEDDGMEGVEAQGQVQEAVADQGKGQEAVADQGKGLGKETEEGPAASAAEAVGAVRPAGAAPAPLVGGGDMGAIKSGGGATLTAHVLAEAV